MTARDNVGTTAKNRSATGRYVTVSKIALVTGTIGVVAAIVILRPNGLIAPGVTLFGVGLGGQSTEQATASLAPLAERLQTVPIVLTMTEPDGKVRSFTTDARHMGLALDVPNTVKASYAAGSSSLGTVIASNVTGAKTVAVTPAGGVMRSRALHIIREAALHLNKLPVDARIIPMPKGGLGLRHDKPGLEVNVQASYAAVSTAWAAYLQQQSNSETGSASVASGNTGQAVAPTPTTAPATSGSASNGALPPLKVNLIAAPAAASITYDELSAINSQLSSFTTYYMVGARGDNVSLAASRINGTVLMPGQVFSYNRTVGPRIASDGFKPAPVIIDGQLKPGMGGGVCQPSSTLYNAVLLAGLKVIERVHHGFPVHYLPPGRDATVAYGAIDFQFENSSHWPIYISAHGVGGVLQFTIFGHKVPGQSIEVVHGYTHYGDVPVETVPDYSLPPGRRETEREGHPDIRAMWYRIVKQDGKVVSREPLYTHYYPFPTVVEVGAVRPAPKPAPPTSPGIGNVHNAGAAGTDH